MAEEEVLRGGVANAGKVTRVGDEVLRPPTENSATLHALLKHVRADGFDGVPEPLGVAHDGRERFRYIPGAVAHPPFPAWSQTDAVLSSMCVLLRRFHDATRDFPRDGTTWSGELADPIGDDVIYHNDVCPENVVFRDGIAIALLDLDFAAPGRREFDIAAFAGMCVPLAAPEDAARTGRGGLDPFLRLRLVADAYGLPADRRELMRAVDDYLTVGHSFVRRRVDAGDEAFIAMWSQMGGEARFARRREWFEKNRQRFSDVLG